MLLQPLIGEVTHLKTVHELTEGGTLVSARRSKRPAPTENSLPVHGAVDSQSPPGSEQAVTHFRYPLPAYTAGSKQDAAGPRLSAPSGSSFHT